jgi:NADH-quinone oxidoreductase subunit M
MLALIVVFVPLVILYSWNETPVETGQPARRSTHAYFALLLALESTMIGVFAAADVFLFYVFFEVMLVRCTSSSVIRRARGGSTRR